MAICIHARSHVHTHREWKPHQQKDKHEEYDSSGLHSANRTSGSTLSGLSRSSL